MRFDLQRPSNKPIKIKRGINVIPVLTVIAFVVIALVIGTSKQWMPDDRKIMNLNTENDINFNHESVHMNDLFIDREKKIAEVYLTVKSKDILDDLSYNLKLEGLIDYEEGTYVVIKGGILPTTEKDSYQQEVLVQFALPDEFYYISLFISQKNVKTEEIQMDYRNMTEKQLSDKESDYLSMYDDLNIQIIKQEGIVNELQKEVDGYTKTIETLEKELMELETKIKVITDEKALAEKKQIIEVNKKSTEENKKKLEESTGKLENEKRTLENLQREKEE